MEQVNVHWYVDNVSAHSAEIAIAGLPGVGYVGKLVVDHLIRSLSAMKIAEITSTLFPPQMYLNEDAVLHLPCNEIFFVPGINKQTSVIFLAGDYQSTSSEGHYTLAEEYLRVFDLLGVRRIYTLGGYSIGRMVEHPRVISAISSSFLREEVLAVGAVIIPEGPVSSIVGVVGLIITLGHLHGMEGIALLGETSGYLVDPVSSIAVLDVLERLTQIRADRTELTNFAKQMMSEVAAIVNTERANPSDDLSYIG